MLRRTSFRPFQAGLDKHAVHILCHQPGKSGRNLVPGAEKEERDTVKAGGQCDQPGCIGMTGQRHGCLTC
jgi:hypothetical protein